MLETEISHHGELEQDSFSLTDRETDTDAQRDIQRHVRRDNPASAHARIGTSGTARHTDTDAHRHTERQTQMHRETYKDTLDEIIQHLRTHASVPRALVGYSGKIKNDPPAGFARARFAREFKRRAGAVASAHHASLLTKSRTKIF